MRDNGRLLPIAPCGRGSLVYLRQYTNFSRASARVRNQCAFRHSARSRPLKASTLIVFGKPVATQTRSSVAMTVFGQIAEPWIDDGENRLNVSTTVSTRIF